MRRVLLCSGKVAYDLLAAREAEGSDDVAVVRVEQLYPLPSSELVQTLERYPNAGEVVWVQEEPANMGAWQFMAVNLPAELPAGKTLSVVSRKASASPAVGSAKVHEAAGRTWSVAPSRSSPEGAARCTSPTAASRSWSPARGEEEVSLAWLGDQLQAFVDEFPDFEVPVERLATWLARGGTDDDETDRPALPPPPPGRDHGVVAGDAPRRRVTGRQPHDQQPGGHHGDVLGHSTPLSGLAVGAAATLPVAPVRARSPSWGGGRGRRHGDAARPRPARLDHLAHVGPADRGARRAGRESSPEGTGTARTTPSGPARVRRPRRGRRQASWAALLLLALAIGLALRALHVVVPGRFEETVVGNLVLSWGGAWLLLAHSPGPGWCRGRSPWACWCTSRATS